MKKYTIEYIKQFFYNQNCELLETEYINSNTKMKYRCECGNISSIIWDSFRRGTRCSKCGIIRNIKKQRFSQEIVNKMFENNNCKCIGEYKGALVPIEYICSCGNVSKITPAKFKSGQRCEKCARKKRSEKLKHSYEFVKKYFEDNGCELLEDAYINNTIKMKYKCRCGKVSYINLHNFKMGKRCKECGFEKNRGENNANWNPNRDEIKNNDIWRKKIRGMLHGTLKRIGTKKENLTDIILGYSSKDLKKHIESHPNWVNVKNDKWNIDHIFPVQAFIDHNILDIKVINSLDNLQPLSQFDNFSKHAKYIEEEFLEYCKTHGVMLNDI